ncbi:hypothetical protein ACFX2B_010226 [Malus domestica]
MNVLQDTATKIPWKWKQKRSIGRLCCVTPVIIGGAATSRLPPPQCHDWHHRNCFKTWPPQKTPGSAAANLGAE